MNKTISLCPYCLKKIDAEYVERDDKIYMEKRCEEHGDFSVMVWKGIESWNKWHGPIANVTIKNPHTKIQRGCPYDCGICEDHRQMTCCVLMEVTSRCNLNCPVCFASSGSSCDKEDPNLSKIEYWYDMLMEHGGPFNIQLSGGEPTLRDDLKDIISLGKEKGFTFFQLNTNGIRIAEDKDYLASLVLAGLNTVFLQFDGLKDKSYIDLRGKDILKYKIKAIENCKELKIGVVLTPTIKKGVNDDEIGDILKFAMKNIPYVRGVNFQPMSFFGRYKDTPNDEDRFTIPEVLSNIESQTEGKFKMSDFSSGRAEHPFCSFHGDYYIKDGKPMHVKSSNSGCCSTSKNARDVVADKWSLHNESENLVSLNKVKYRATSLDDFLKKRNLSRFSVSGMAFQDVWNLDLERLKRCYIHEISEDGRLIPFCSYNLTSIDGKALYRGNKNA